VLVPEVVIVAVNTAFITCSPDGIPDIATERLAEPEVMFLIVSLSTAPVEERSR
jgi:hypothetical protein